ncbi:hypothetical protein ANN_22456 [Periplaneta americana]|uniref:Regulatory protein zeste n=1 Tax=Periplaneta americana TaxID=6978 RepID=A0ABQ8S868_PERAM|nr:hypothetical protein ANN_22456 [Periplaneta americana]
METDADVRGCSERGTSVTEGEHLNFSSSLPIALTMPRSKNGKKREKVDVEALRMAIKDVLTNGSKKEKAWGEIVNEYQQELGKSTSEKQLKKKFQNMKAETSQISFFKIIFKFINLISFISFKVFGYVMKYGTTNCYSRYCSSLTCEVMIVQELLLEEYCFIQLLLNVVSTASVFRMMDNNYVTLQRNKNETAGRFDGYHGGCTSCCLCYASKILRNIRTVISFEEKRA